MKPFLDSDSIDRITNRISKEVSHSYPETERLVIIAVDNSSLPFACSLMGKITLPVEFDTVHLDVHSSPRGNISVFHKLPQINLSGKNVLIVSSCIRHGDAIEEVRKKLDSIYEVLSFQHCSLLKIRDTKVYINYLGSAIDKKAIPYGYGMTVGGLHANLPEVYLNK